ncbi:hypothetical protein GTD56_005026 [Salmonella enterica subsp. diarizonae]|nr:hypothetical protein [Salmonella enterica subsp. diarizonae]EEN5590856.1 hypothetical protein [Salmonella enterica subsp. enterica serovar Mountpleasant]
MTTRLIKTEPNYRTAFSLRSDFLLYNDFPEVYHGEGIIIPLFYAPAERITEQGINTTYRIIII